MSDGQKDFLLGLIIMAVVIIFAFWITRDDQNDPTAGAGCDATQVYAQGGC